MGYRFLIALAGILGALGVIIGALGAHVFDGALQGKAAVLFEKAWRYHMLHVFGLIVCAWLVWLFEHGLESQNAWSAKLAALLFIVGIVLFSGVLYIQALAGGEPRLPIVPVGGTSYILGWLLVAVSGMRAPRF